MKQRTAILGIELVVVGRASLLKAQRRLVACQGCSASVSRSFGSVLTEVLGAASPFSEYVLGESARCPNCSQPILETTLVRCEGELEGETPNAIRDFTPSWDDTNVVLVDEILLSEAEASLSGCEQCVENGEMTFDYILDSVTQCDPAVTEYVMCRPAKCPCCHHEVTEKTFIVAH